MKKLRSSNFCYDESDRRISLELEALEAIYHTRRGLGALRRLMQRWPLTDWALELSLVFCAILFEPPPDALLPWAEVKTCQLCGCTDDHACDGGCAWADDEHTVCTRCVLASLELALAPESEVAA